MSNIASNAAENKGETQTEKAPENVPAFQFSVLTCAYGQATKAIYADGKEIAFSKVKHFYYHYAEIDTLEDFAKLALTWLADQPNKFIIRGQLIPGLPPLPSPAPAGSQYRRILSRTNEPATIECPPRSWIVLELDGVAVLHGLGAADKLIEAAYYIRDHLLPSYFRGVRCVAAATASTGRMGPDVARLRLFFLLPRPADNFALYNWADALSRSRPDLKLDPSVMQAMQPIYTARPIFRGMSDPVPVWGRVRLLDGFAEHVSLDLPCVRVRKAKVRTSHAIQIVSDDEMPDWLLALTEEDAGRGVAPIDTSAKARNTIRRVFEMLDGCPKPGGQGRHKTLTRAGWELACLVAEGELPEAFAREAYLEAAGGIYNADKKYDAAAIQRRLDDAFSDVRR
jgi:hypothetical protein